MTHHADCDGSRLSHRVHVERINQGRGMFQAHCEECGWVGQLFGADAGMATAISDGATHDAGWVACDSRCLAWT